MFTVIITQNHYTHSYKIIFNGESLAEGHTRYFSYNPAKKQFHSDSVFFNNVDSIETEEKPNRITDNGWQFY